jgi:hypothetical protein
LRKPCGAEEFVEVSAEEVDGAEEVEIDLLLQAAKGIHFHNFLLEPT